jgi:hypothetical protein
VISNNKLPSLRKEGDLFVLRVNNLLVLLSQFVRAFFYSTKEPSRKKIQLEEWCINFGVVMFYLLKEHKHT